MTTIAANVRQPLATALASVGASVYAVAPEALIAPACAIMPGSPYLESTLIGSDKVRVKINLIVTGAVAYNANSGALDNLEKLMLDILGAMPNGYEVGDVTRPGVTTVGTGNFLTADLSVSTYYTQEI
jgi:hypothetical protein